MQGWNPTFPFCSISPFVRSLLLFYPLLVERFHDPRKQSVNLLSSAAGPHFWLDCPLLKEGTEDGTEGRRDGRTDSLRGREGEREREKVSPAALRRGAGARPALHRGVDWPPARPPETSLLQPTPRFPPRPIPEAPAPAGGAGRARATPAAARPGGDAAAAAAAADGGADAARRVGEARSRDGRAGRARAGGGVGGGGGSGGSSRGWGVGGQGRGRCCGWRAGRWSGFPVETMLLQPSCVWMNAGWAHVMCCFRPSEDDFLLL